MALVTTFITTPLTTILYPPWYQVKVDRWRRGEIDWDGNPVQQDHRSDSVSAVKDQLKTIPVRKLLVYLRLDGLSGICTLAALLSPSRRVALSSPQAHPSKKPKPAEQSIEDAVTTEDDTEITLRVHGVRLIELTDRDSSVMKVSAGEQAMWDPVVNTFRAFGEWQDVSLMAGVSVVPEYSYAETVINMTHQDTADLLLLPWSETGTLADRQSGLEVDTASRFANGAYTDFVSNILERVPSHVGIFIEHNPESRSAKRPSPQRSTSGLSIHSVWSRPASGSRSRHIVLPFFGGDDDRFALRLVLQLAQNEQVTATIIQVAGLQPEMTKARVSTVISSGASAGTPSTQSDIVFFETLRDSVPQDLEDRIIFQQAGAHETISDPVQLALAAVKQDLDLASKNKRGSIVVVGRRSGPSDSSFAIDLGPQSIATETQRALGPVASAMVQPENKVFGSVLVLQAGVSSGLFDNYR